MKKVDISSNLNSRIKLFADWLNNGGVKTIWSQNLLEDLIKVKFDDNGNVVEETVSSVVRAAILAYEGTQIIAPSSFIEFMTEYETLLQKELFFEQVNIETEKDFDSIFEEHIDSKDILYRGTSEAKWRLYSSLQRYWINEKIYKKGIDYKSFVEKLAENAKKQQGNVLEKYFKKNGINPNNDIAILSFLQHHGCPTPLVDWSSSFVNSLYFATENIKMKKDDIREIDKYFSVYYIEEKDLNSTSLVNVVEMGISEMQKHVRNNVIKNGESEGISKIEMDKFFSEERLKLATKMIHQNSLIEHLTKTERMMEFPLTYFSDINEENDVQFSLNNSMNIVNQQGVFVWNSHPYKPIELVGNEQYNKNKNAIYRFSKCYNINKNLAPYIIEKISKLGIIKDYIYPDPNLIASNCFKETKTSC